MAEEVAENFIVESLYRDYLGEFSVYKNPTHFQNNCPHWLLPTTNLNTDVLPLIPSHSRFKFQIRRPRPFLPPTKVNLASFKEGDPLEVMVQKKQKWFSDLQTLLSLGKKGKKWSDQQQYPLNTSKIKKKSNPTHIYTVDSYMDVAKHVEKDPYPHFSGNYNWLCTGGCINSCSINEGNYLLFPHGDSMDTLCILNFKHPRALLDADEDEPYISLPLTQGQRIYQTVARQKGGKGIIGIRQEHVSSIVSVKQGSKKPLKAQIILEIQENDANFVSMDMKPLECDQMCTSDSNRLLKLWDLNSSSCTASAKLPAPEHESNSNSWSFVKFGDNSQELFVANRSKFFIKDPRMSLSESGTEFSIRPIVDDCEDITLLLISPSSSLVYVSTSHRLLSLDPRFGWVQRWTHLMEGAPMYGSIYSDARNAEEVVLLSSSIPDDSVAIVNKWEHEKRISETLPRSLPSLRDCLVLARSRGECLGPNTKKRLDMATSGLTILPSEYNEGFTSLKITSIGDVFSQQFMPELIMLHETEVPYLEEETESDVEAWKNWEMAHDKIESQQSSELRCATFPLEPIFKAISSPLGKEKDVITKSDVAQWRGAFPEKTRLKWIKNNFPFEHDTTTYDELIYELSSYTDLMAGVLLQAWDTAVLHSCPEPSKYVETWLGTVSSGQGDADTSSLGVYSGVSTRSRTRSLMSSYGENLDPDTQADDVVFKVPPAPKSKPSKKVKRESSGF